MIASHKAGKGSRLLSTKCDLYLRVKLGRNNESRAAEALPMDAVLICAAVALPSISSFLSYNKVPRKCKGCFGAGYLPCNTCNGRGKVGGCFKQAQQPLTSCSGCLGKGRQGCMKCGSTGLANSWLWSPKKGPGIWGAPGEW
ncbi:hypothetical protein CEUSTIGMA_g2601.t1 [Chlamydomonas eustigma]|uniref:Uncharacterized protein n=1 Tax=Chlamydomonas eustigma TaxID=1157962 RepID=A0A250WWE5_9CHLO|nr:hypothetical protein CEUSTIGMA_g2601.t1 [Chlamydomonas eustigma]|eukprot:GAX75157.1 hypothetical protein CEUSTIGMA_g2601.t1 [Chlamydomonas eustigma]